MTDEGRQTLSRPLEPRLKMPANPMMAQPVGEPDPDAVPDAPPIAEPENLSAKEVEPVPTAKPQPRPDQSNVETIPSLDSTPKSQAQRSKPRPQRDTSSAPTRPQKAPVVQDPLPVAKTEPKVEPVPSPSNEATAEAENADFPRNVQDTLRLMDNTWASFRAAALNIPLKGLDEKIGSDGWTRKQMLAHVAAWHDLTADRLVKLINFGELVQLDRDTDQFNAAVARQAVGKTSGEVLKDLDATYNRLRRQVARMTDAQLESNEWFAAWVIGGNSYGHYEEHWADVSAPGGLRR